MGFAVEFKAEDCWVGVFWRRGPVRWPRVSKMTSLRLPGSVLERRIDLWICLLPMFPIHLWWTERLHKPINEHQDC